MKLSMKFMSAVFGASLVLSGIALSSAISAPAFAQTASAKSIVDNAKAKGLVGERIDGYLGLVTGRVSPEVQSAVNEINIRRKSLFTKLAREQGVEIAVISRLTGEKLIAKASAGEKTMGDDGVWRTK